MPENPETIPETIRETAETNPEKEPDPVPDPEPPAPEAVPENPAPKRRGRPEGAKDRAPRKKKVVVVEEHIEAPQETPSPPQQSPRQSPVEETKPESPRTLIRDAAEHILKLKNVTKMARKAHLQETYTKRLHSLGP